MFRVLILLTCIIGLDAHSTLMRSVSVQAGGEVEAAGRMQEYSKAFTESLVALATVPQSQKLSESLLALMQGKSSPDELLRIIKGLQGETVAWNSNASDTLEKSHDAIKACGMTMSVSMGKAGDKKTVCTEKGTSHKSNREDESKKCTEKEHWEEESAKNKTNKGDACATFQKIKVEARAAKAHYNNGDEEAFLMGVEAQFCDDLLPRYEEWEKKCAKATSDMQTTLAITKKKTEVCETQHEDSNEIQKEMGIICCEYSMTTKSTCHSYDGCYAEKVAEFNDLKTVVQSEEAVHKVAWRVLKSIECLLEALDHDEGSSKIAECRKIVHETGHLDIDYVPPPVPPKDPCEVEANYPGTDGYYNFHFGALPPNSKSVPVALCTGMMTEQEQEQPYVVHHVHQQQTVAVMPR